jgi:hypothetical protein
MCKSLQSQYDSLTTNAVYCLAVPTAPGCAAVIEKAEAAKAADKPLYEECLLNEAKFNAKHASTPAMQRTDHCTYELNGTGGPNSKGERWSRLLPAACQAGAYVDRAGTDCCDGNKMSLGGFGKQCGAFLVPK